MERTTEIQIRGYHVDFYGHVNNARYLEFLEEARWSLFEKHIDFEEWKGNGTSFFVVNVNISYRRPAFLGETIEIQSGITGFTTRTCTLSQKIFLKGTGTVIADAEVTFVITDSSGKPARIKGDLLAMLKPFAVQEI